MHVLSALPLLLATASALRITSISHSGPACPQSTPLDITHSGPLHDLTLSIPGLSATVAASQTTNCAVHLVLEGGRPGKALVLDGVQVWGRLGLEAGGAADFYTTAFWSEDAANTATTKRHTSSSTAFSDNVSVATSLGLHSPCVGADGSVGILNLNFRIASEKGKVTFGPERVAGRTYPISQHLGLAWENC